MISPAFVEANYEILESLLRDWRRQIRNEDLRMELEYFSEDYDEEREIEPRPERTRKVTPPLRTRSPRVRRQRERVVGFEEAPNREGSRTGRNTEGNRPLKDRAEENGRREMNLPPLLAAHLKRNENGQPLQSSLTSVYEGRQSSINIGWDLPPNDPTGSVTPFVRWIEDYPLPDGLKMPSHVASKRGSRRRTWQFTPSNKEKAGVSKLSPLGPTHGLKQEKLPQMDPQMIGGITLKGQGNPPRTTPGVKKVETCSPLTGDLITDCSPAYLKVQEIFSP
ncbi:hypothetical protein Tco_1386412 [Tanacetum coccineum]